MINRRVKPYIIGVCIVVVLSMSYIGIRAYKGNVELNQALSEARAINRSVGARHSHSSDNDAHVREGDLPTTAPQHDVHHYSVGREGYTYEIDSIREIVSPEPMSKEELELSEWIVTGKRTPYVEKKLKEAELLRQQNAGRVFQQIITPDGQLGTVVVHEDKQCEDGDAILRSDLITRSHPWGFSMDQVKAKRSEEFKFIKDGVEYTMPDEYFTLDEYERNEYFKKFRLSLDLDISMDEVEAKIAAGELDVSLTDTEKKQIEARLSIDAALLQEKKHRAGLLDSMGPKPTLSDTPPVNVTFKPVNALPIAQSQNDDKGFWESVLADVEKASDESIDEPSPTPKVVPEQPKSTRQVNRTTDVENSVAVEESPLIPDNLTSESVNAQLKERLTPEQFSKAQQLLDEYGAEEGLRKFREIPLEHKGVRQHSNEKP